MNNNIQCSIESSTTKIELNSAVEGVFLVPELEGLAGLPEIRTTSGVNAGYDGGWTSAQNYDARLISIRGVIANPDISKVEDKRRAIASLLGQGRKEQLTLRFTTEAGNAYAISVRTISCEMALQRVLTTQEFLIQLRADDPLIYDDGVTGGIAAILQPQRALGGFEINFGLPLAIGGGAEDTVVDNGNETVYPVIKLYGALHSPTVVNRTTNQQMQILADLQYSIDWHTYRSATGDYILVNDGLNGAPMTLSQLTGNAEQTTYSGKNLARPNGNNTAAGVSFVWNSDGTITLNGTATAAIDVWVANGGSGATEFTIPTGTKLTQSFRVVSGSASANTWTIRTNLYYGGASHWSDVVGNTTFTATSETQVRGLEVLAPSSGLKFNNLRLEIQLEKSATATTWERYVGGTPAPNPSYPQPISTVTGAQNIKVTGKNLWDNFGPSTKSASITWTPTDNGGTFINTGTWSTGLVWNYTLDTTQQYTVQLSTPSDRPLYFYARSYTDGTYTTESTRYVQEGRGNISKTFQPDTPYVRLFFWNSQAINDGVSVQNMMFGLSSTATAYEPYQGQSYEVNLGKNLFDKDNADILGAYIGGSIPHTISMDGANTSVYIPCQPNITYTISKVADNVFRAGTTTETPASGVVVNDYVDNASGTSITLTSSSNAKYLVVFLRNASSSHTQADLLASLQIEKGGQATSYAPYFTPIELAKVGDYQDRIYKNDGKWYIEKQVGKVVLDGSNEGITWSLTTTGSSYAFWFRNYTIGMKTTEHPKLCDRFTYSAHEYTTAPTPSLCENQHPTYDGGYMTIFKVDSTIATTINEWKTWLASNPTTVYYALNTPTTTEITDETLRAQLNFLASLYGGVNNISLVGTGAQGDMAISYATGYTVNQDVITIDSQARTITLNGQDVYHLKTSESEFLVLAPGENKLYLTSEVSDDSGYAEVKFKQGYLSI